MTAGWPVDITFTFLVSDYSSPVPSAALFSQMEAGSLKSRRRWSEPPRTQSGTIPMSALQLGIFEQWYREDLASGTLPFSATHPTSGQTNVWLFAEPPTPRPHGSGHRWHVAVKLVSVPSILPPVIAGDWDGGEPGDEYFRTADGGAPGDPFGLTIDGGTV